MSRTFLSIGAGGPRIGVVLGRRDMARFVAVLAIPFGALALFGGATDMYGDGLGFLAASALIALLWFAWSRRPQEWSPLFPPPPPLGANSHINRLDALKFTRFD
jgi:hypothetical protein